eukprot:13689-Heterococcus_DN1.PRE.1
MLIHGSNLYLHSERCMRIAWHEASMHWQQKLLQARVAKGRWLAIAVCSALCNWRYGGRDSSSIHCNDNLQYQEAVVVVVQHFYYSHDSITRCLVQQQ